MGSVNFHHIYKYYKGEASPSVNDFHLQVEDGEFLVLVGPSGCGKSTTLRMLAGLEEITGGELYIDGKFTNYVSPKDRDIAMVFQNYALYPNLTVYDNMALGLQLRKVAKHEVELRVGRAARMLEISHLLARKPAQLSGGQKQRVALGRALVREPKVFLMDEPLSNLDAKLRTQTRSEIIKMHAQLRTTFVYVTHDQTEAMTMGTRIVVMKDGRIQQVAPPQQLYDEPANLFVAGFIGTPQMNFMEGAVVQHADGYYFENRRLKLRIPDRYRPCFKLHGAQLRNLVLGLRPEHILPGSYQPGQPGQSEQPGQFARLGFAGAELGAEASGDAGWLVPGVVEMREPMGSDTYLHAAVGDTVVISRSEAHTPLRPGDPVMLAFRMDKAHFFDRESGSSLLALAAAQEEVG